MLDVTLTTEFRPGTNLKGGSAGGNWSYVLPSLDREQVVCLGVPSTASLITLARSATRVVVLCRSQSQANAARKSMEPAGLNETVFPVVWQGQEVPQIADRSTDLVLITDRREIYRFAFSGQMRNRCKRWLKPRGQLYFELAGFAYWAVLTAVLRIGRREREDVQRLWLTPLWGESQTFAALSDHNTIEYFRRHRLTGTSLRTESLKKLATPAVGGRVLQRATDGVPGKPPPPGKAPVAERTRRRRSWLRQGKTLLRPAGRGVLRVWKQCEDFLSRPNGWAGWLGRRGILMGPEASRLSHEPPAYLRAIANNSGVSIDAHRWGLSATGDYDSRKLVFFLFDRSQSSLEYVVKMTRATSFNSRLEQERRALELLEAQGIGDRETLPRIVFSGTHGGLAIVGETAIQGVPFDQRTTATAACPYARAAVDWLTELGSATVAPFAAEPGEVAAGLQRLLARFADLYGISADEHAFLRAQISIIEFNRVPLVFQHGDPGRWNVFVTSKGRIGFLDWEAAEPNGMPLWDLLYFLRSFCICVADNQGLRDRLRSIDELFLHDSSMAELAVDSVRNYCVNTGLPGPLIEPLFHTCWMHRALKEATRLPPARLRDGHYYNLLRMCRENRESSTLRRLFSLG